MTVICGDKAEQVPKPTTAKYLIKQTIEFGIDLVISKTMPILIIRTVKAARYNNKVIIRMNKSFIMPVQEEIGICMSQLRYRRCTRIKSYVQISETNEPVGRKERS